MGGGPERTLEDVIREMLRPMLQGWLDERLPEIIERLVRAELARALGEMAPN
jgi:cell pole-organizing protein PopZ